MTIPFVIISQPRTGSTLVSSLLSSHEGVRAIIEPINPTGHNHNMQPTGNEMFPDIVVQYDLISILNVIFNPDPILNLSMPINRRADIAAGFKIMIHQIRALRSEHLFWQYLKERNVKTILVLRHNIVMQYISDLITIATGQTSCWDGKLKTTRISVPIDTLEEKLENILKERKYIINIIRSMGLNYRRLNYENFKDDIGTVNNILPWLIGEKGYLSSRLCKQNPDSMSMRVKNYDELVGKLRELGMSKYIIE
jgi:hypothetical protein